MTFYDFKRGKQKAGQCYGIPCSRMELTGIVWLPCRLLIAAWASWCELNLTNAQPANKMDSAESVSVISENIKF
jgi:hypothetical protein